jgi:hypothetical protein
VVGRKYWVFGKYIMGVSLLIYSHIFLTESKLATPIYIRIKKLILEKRKIKTLKILK